MRILLVFGVLGLAALASAAPPTGKRTERLKATHVVVHLTELSAQGVLAQVAPGVGVFVDKKDKPRGGKVTGTLVTGAEITGVLEQSALGERVAQDTDIFSEDGQPIGTARAGAFVIPVSVATGGRTLVTTVSPTHARVLIATSALSAEPRELVYPDPTGVLVAAGEEADLFPTKTLAKKPRAHLEAGARVVVVEELGTVVHVHSYGEFEIDGYVAFPKLVKLDQMAPLPGPPSRGLNPNFEALVDTPLFADGDGKKPIGTLRGGTLMTAGKDKRGDLLQVMTHGDVVIEAWVGGASLRTVDGSIWSEGP